MPTPSNSVTLPIHGFVLAGGKSSRMGRDKATMLFHGRPLIEIAVEKLRTFCTNVSIAGNRDDLASFAPIVHEQRTNTGLAAGIEAGLKASQQEWVLFIPVDVPLVPQELLRSWAEHVLHAASAGELTASYLQASQPQPTFCMLRRKLAESFSAALAEGERKLTTVFDQASNKNCWIQDACDLLEKEHCGQDIATQWFTNLNTPEDLALAEQLPTAKAN